LTPPKSSEYGTIFTVPETLIMALAASAGSVTDVAVSVMPDGLGIAAGATYAALVVSEEASDPQAGAQAPPAWASVQVTP
jgi:hypothetical protein